jgi:transcriptional regulator of acetoin/glycerol metabolism
MQKPTATEQEIRTALVAEKTLTAAAARMGVSRMTLYRWMKHYGIQVERQELKVA